VRFDDSLSTVLAADTSSAFGAQSAFRQLVDLVGRGRVASSPEMIARLEALRPHVPAAIRAAAARGLALASPPVDLIAFFAEDEPAVAAAALRGVTLDEAGWDGLLPRIGPAGRAVLRARPELPESARRGLHAFGSTDFTLPFDGTASAETLPEPVESSGPAPSPPPPHGFPIAELVDRIAAFHRGEAPASPAATPAMGFSFETDTLGRVCWTDVEPRGALVGLTLDGELRSAIRGRRRAGGIPLILPGASPLGGSWQVDAEPAFDAQGRHLGARGHARRAPVASRGSGDAIRQLVHELRTPMNAISGFAELMESELLGPVPPVHRAAAGAIHTEMAELLGAIEDLDMAARIDGHTLDLASSEVALWPMLERHGTGVALHGTREAIVHADARALDRLLHRFFGLLDPAARVEVASDGCWSTLRADRPVAGAGNAASPAPLLGMRFTLRLIGDLARELGGTFVEEDRLTLRLPGRLDPGARIGGSM
jgi:His Kinase A (phospho-acceptor) domain